MSWAYLPALLGHRVRERIEWQLLDRDRNPVGVLDVVRGSGEISESIHRESRGAGTVTIRDTNLDIDKHMVRPWYRCGDATTPQTYAEWPLGTFLMSGDTVHTTRHGQVRPVELIDRTSLLRDHAYARTLSESIHGAITRQPWTLLDPARPQDWSVTRSPETPGTALTWEPGTPVYRIINDQLKAINYYGVYTDPLGVFQLHPYVLPASRPSVFRFVDDTQSVYLPEFERSQAFFEVPNQITLKAQGPTHDAPPLFATAVNADPESRFSTVRRGRVIAAKPETVEAANQQTLDALAQRRLAELSTSKATGKLTTAMLPLRAHDAIELTNTRTQLATRGTITAWQVRDQTPILMSLEIREIA